MREGIVYHNLSEAEKKKDPLIEAAKFFEKKETRFPNMSKHTFKWISPLYENLPRKTKRVILAATKLHDIAWIAHPDYKTEMCLDLVTRSNISGLSHKERVFLAMILLFRHKAKPEKVFNSKLFKIVSKKKRKIALVIGKGLRLASTFFGEKSLFDKIDFRLKAHEVELCFQSKIDFINNSRFTILLSGALLLAGIFSLIINNGPKLSIDFKGGTLVAVQYTKPININNLRSELKTVTINGQKFDFSTSEIKHFGNKSKEIIVLRFRDLFG